MTQNVSQRPKKANISKIKGDGCLESVLINHLVGFTPNVAPIRNFLVASQNFLGELHLLTRARIEPHIEKNLKIVRKKLVYQHGAPTCPHKLT